MFLVLSIPRLLLLTFVLLNFQSCRVISSLFYVFLIWGLNISLYVHTSTLSKCGFVTVSSAGQELAAPPQHCSQHHILHSQAVHTSQQVTIGPDSNIQNSRYSLHFSTCKQWFVLSNRIVEEDIKKIKNIKIFKNLKHVPSPPALSTSSSTAL